MSQRHEDVPKQSRMRDPRLPDASRYQLPWPSLITVIALALATLACGFLGSSSRSHLDRVAVLKRLPTLTRTPLPTLSPTLDLSSAQAAALAAEPVLTAPTSTPVLVPTFTPASSDTVARHELRAWGQ